MFSRIVPKIGFCLAAGLLLSPAVASQARAQACPDWQLGGVPIATDADQAWTPQRYQIQAGGMLDLSACATVPGVGHVTQAPQLTLRYDDRAMGRDLELRVESQCDTMLLVNTATAGWEFVDDADGTLNPRMRLSGAPAGQYDIWIGTYGAESCPATLIAETFDGQGPAQCPDWQLGGAEVSLTTGQQETRPVVAGGPISLSQSNCGIQASGHVAQAPDFTLFLETQNQLTTLDIRVTGDCDQTLLINDPGTNWVFVDDTNGLNPQVTIGDAQPGRYDIWVGTFGSQTCPSTVTFSATSPQGAGGGAAPSK